MKAVIKNSLILLSLACMCFLLAGGWHGRADDSPELSVQLPGELSEVNNVVFTQDGKFGLVATYFEMDGAGGHSIYSFDSVSGSLLSKFDTFPTGTFPTKLTLSSNNTIIVSAKST